MSLSVIWLFSGSLILQVQLWYGADVASLGKINPLDVHRAMS